MPEFAEKIAIKRIGYQVLENRLVSRPVPATAAGPFRRLGHRDRGRMKNLFTILLLGLGFAFVLPLCRRKDTAAGKVALPRARRGVVSRFQAELAG